MTYEPTLEHARRRDEVDPLRAYRERFALPRDERGKPLVYLCGHSLGLLPLAARDLVMEELDDWARLGVLGHEHARRPWIPYHENLAAGLAYLTGARAGEVIAMNSLTVNLHLMLASFYRPAGRRTKILIETGAASILRMPSSSSHRPQMRTRSQKKRSNPASSGREARLRWCCGPACNSGRGRHSIWRVLHARRAAPVASQASIWRTPSATCRSPCTSRRRTSQSGAATSI
jgi:hypothetical protein